MTITYLVSVEVSTTYSKGKISHAPDHTQIAARLTHCQTLPYANRHQRRHSAGRRIGFGGVTLLSQRADAVLGPEPAPLTVVSAMTLSPQLGLTVTRRFQGQVEPAQTVNLAFQQAGEIERLTVDEGDSVRAGDVIAQLDTQILDAERTRLEASRRAVEAQLELAELTTQRQSELRDRGFASEQALDTARLTLADLEARIAEIDAGLTRIDVQLAQTRLIAPFDGTIATRLADEGTVASVGQPIVEVLQSSAPLFRVGIDPSLANDQDALARSSSRSMGSTMTRALMDFAQISIRKHEHARHSSGLRPKMPCISKQAR